MKVINTSKVMIMVTDRSGKAVYHVPPSRKPIDLPNLTSPEDQDLLPPGIMDVTDSR